MSPDNADSQIPEDTMGELKLAECDGVEITPEMIEAGVEVLREFDLQNVVEGWDSKDEVVRAVLDAAFRVVQENQQSAEASLGYPRISRPFALLRMFLK